MAKPKGSPKTGGRQPGTPNKIGGDVRDMVLNALAQAGGQDYLAGQATENPAAFMALVGRCIPRDVKLSGTLTLADLVRAAIQAEKPESAPLSIQ